MEQKKKKKKKERELRNKGCKGLKKQKKNMCIEVFLSEINIISSDLNINETLFQGWNKRKQQKTNKCKTEENE